MAPEDVEAGRAMLLRQGKGRPDLRLVACVATFAAAYLLLLPGLWTLLFSARAVVTVFGVELTVVDLQKSTLGTVHLLYSAGAYAPMLAILVFSVIMPFVKLAAVLAFAFVPGANAAVLAVQRISKWATIDAFAAAALVAFFANHPPLVVNLHCGFYCFLGYCLLSVAAALLLRSPKDRAPASGGPVGWRSAVLAVCGTAAMLRLTYLATTLPILKMASPRFHLADACSTWDILAHLWAGGFRVAAVAVGVLVVALPSVDFVVCATREAGLAASAPAARWLEEFAMLDVWALALVVTRFATVGISRQVQMEMLPAGWALAGCCALWAAYTAAGRPRLLRAGGAGDLLLGEKSSTS